MKWIARVQTRDGLLHNDVRAAERHAEKMYGLALTGLAHKLLRQEKYTAMTEFLDANLGTFLELHALKQDLVLEKTELFGDVP